jgi:uncharacterized membrane protein YoaK (UPF0700 family)
VQERNVVYGWASTMESFLQKSEQKAEPRLPRPQRRLVPVFAVLLLGIAGYVDAVGYMQYVQIFAANMSGNHIRLGISLVEGKYDDALLRLLPIVAFAAGAVASEMIVRVSGAQRRLRTVAGVWMLEVLCLGVAAWVDPGHGGGSSAVARLLPLGLLSLGMGLQNTTLRRVGGSSLYTTHVTGALTRACMVLADYFTTLLPGRHRRAGERRGRFSTVLFRWSLPLVYLGGAVGGAAAVGGWGAACLVVPAGLLVGLAVFVAVPGGETPAGGAPPAG